MCSTFVRQMDRIAGCSAAELYDAIFERTRLYRQVQSWFAAYDIVATLSGAAVPIDQDFFGPIEIDGEPVENIRAAWYPYTMPFNLTGNPAVSLPAGLDHAGMPLAIQLVARLAKTPLCCALPLGSSVRAPGLSEGRRVHKGGARARCFTSGHSGTVVSASSVDSRLGSTLELQSRHHTTSRIPVTAPMPRVINGARQGLHSLYSTDSGDWPALARG
jgi:hypothetical protein